MKQTAQHTVKLSHAYRIECDTYVSKEPNFVLFVAESFEMSDSIDVHIKTIDAPPTVGALIDARNEWLDDLARRLQ